MYKYNAVITNVIDGDTFDLDIDLGFHIHIHERVRLLDIDCPEKTAKNGEDEKKAGLFVTKWAQVKMLQKKVLIKSIKGTDSFGRWLVEMYVDWGNGELEDIRTTYNALGFNKWHPEYNVERLLKHGTNDSCR